jgi:hypothetical protein
MGYSNFKNLKMLTKKYGLDSKRQLLFVPTVEKVLPSEMLESQLKKAYLMPLTNEKAKSERLVSPILMEVVEKYADKISLFSGENIDVKDDADLNGPCDFSFALHPPKDYIDAPIISLVEAKKEDMEYGIGQCAAQMYGAKLFNEQEGQNIEVIYGCATDGIEWQFIKFENQTFYVDQRPITDLGEILGTWHNIIQFYLN